MDLIEIGKHIRERRKELGLDQSTLATLAWNVEVVIPASMFFLMS